jgi:hypothetical protein
MSTLRTALERLHTVCAAMDCEIEGDRPSEAEYQKAMAEAERLLRFVAESDPVKGWQPWSENAPVRLSASRERRIYVAGPMTGIEHFNFPAFNAKADALRAEGWTVLNPADHGIVEGADWGDYLRHDIAGLATCEAIHLLPGWTKSKGARLEHSIATALGMPIHFSEGAESAEHHFPDAGKMVGQGELPPAIETLLCCLPASPYRDKLDAEIRAVIQPTTMLSRPELVHRFAVRKARELIAQEDGQQIGDASDGCGEGPGGETE